MLIGNILEKTPAEYAWQLCADKLADNVRDIWLTKQKQGLGAWEEGFSEDPHALTGLREEGFGALVGLDYIFKYWGGDDTEALAGEISVIWKLLSEDGEHVVCYRSWIKVAERDFILGLYTSERDKREANRAVFRDAFAQWKKLFAEL